MINRRHPIYIVRNHYTSKEGFQVDQCNLCQATPNIPYRLGDMISQNDSRNLDLKETVDNYPNSIVAEYDSRSDKSNNYELLTDIVKKRASKIPTNSLSKILDTCVIHLRTGDVIDHIVDAGHSPEDLVNQKISMNGHHWGFYTPCISDIIEGIDKVAHSKDILLISGTHKYCNKENSCKYVRLIASRLRENDYNVSLRMGEDPDEDYVMMCLAKSFIASGGNYSSSIMKVRELLGSGPSYSTRDKSLSLSIEPGS